MNTNTSSLSNMSEENRKYCTNCKFVRERFGGAPCYRDQQFKIDLVSGARGVYWQEI